MTQLDFVHKFGVLSFSYARFIRHFRVLAGIQLPMTIDHTMKLKRTSHNRRCFTLSYSGTVIQGLLCLKIKSLYYEENQPRNVNDQSP